LLQSLALSPYLTNMPWPEFITFQFELVNKFTTNESEYYGPFNALLNHLFPASEYYQVAPQFKRIAGSMDFIVMYLITGRKIPIWFIEVKSYGAYDLDSSRKAADDQIRERVLDFTAGCSFPKLYGISALGTRFCVYEYTPTSRSLTPLRIDPHSHLVTDTAPKERWDLDFLEPQGEARLKEVVRDIKYMVANLHVGLLLSLSLEIS
jgi:hypothetical protein